MCAFLFRQNFKPANTPLKISLVRCNFETRLTHFGAQAQTFKITTLSYIIFIGGFL